MSDPSVFVSLYSVRNVFSKPSSEDKNHYLYDTSIIIIIHIMVIFNVP